MREERLTAVAPISVPSWRDVESAVNHPLETPQRPDALRAVSVPDAFLSLRTAALAAELSVATLYRKAKTDPNFPKLIKIGVRCTRVRAGDLTAWLASHANQSNDSHRGGK